MNKLNRWIAKHQLVSTFIMAVAMCAVFITALYIFDAPIWLMIILAFLIFLSCWGKAVSVRTKFMDDAVKELNVFCDPYPMLEETELQLTYKNNDNYRQLLLINKSSALSNIGEFQSAYELMKSINIDTQALVQFKVLYYHNLASICTDLGKYEEAEIWYEREMQLYNGMKEGKLKQSLEYMAQIGQVESLYRKGEYAEALEKLKLIRPDTQHAVVCNALEYAKLCIKLGDASTAKEKLRYVITGGKKLYAVTMARELLESLQK